MMFNESANLIFLALGGAPGGGGEGGGNALSAMLPFAIILLIFYFMMIKPQQRKEKERRLMIDAVKSGDRILFGGGIFGTVANARDAHTLVVKIADNTKIEIARGAVAKVLQKGEKSEETTSQK
jgi:preprotein translocase subunit YajC